MFHCCLMTIVTSVLFLSFTYANTFHEGSMQLIVVFQVWVVSLIALCHVNWEKNKCICYFVYLFAKTGCELAMMIECRQMLTRIRQRHPGLPPHPQNHYINTYMPIHTRIPTHVCLHVVRYLLQRLTLTLPVLWVTMVTRTVLSGGTLYPITLSSTPNWCQRSCLLEQTLSWVLDRWRRPRDCEQTSPRFHLQVFRASRGVGHGDEDACLTV